MSIAIAGNNGHTFVANVGTHLHRGETRVLSAPKSVKRHGGTIVKQSGNGTLVASFAPDDTIDARRVQLTKAERALFASDAPEDFFDSRRNRETRAIMQTNRSPFLTA